MDQHRDAVDPGGSAGITAVIVDYCAGAHLLACIESLQADQIGEIVVVDNSERHHSAMALSESGAHVRIVEAGANRGFGAGVNLGLSSTTSPYVLICNPDIVVRPGLTAALLDRMRADRGLAVVGPAMVDPAGSLRQTARAFPSLRRSAGHVAAELLSPNCGVVRRYREANWARSESGTVDWVSGACLLARRAALEGVGGFDEAYFMYLEELDLCWRLNRAGWRVGYERAATALHTGGVSAGRHPYRMLVSRHRSMWRFARRSARREELPLLPLVAIGVAIRLALRLTALGVHDLTRRPVPPPMAPPRARQTTAVPLRRGGGAN